MKIYEAIRVLDDYLKLQAVFEYYGYEIKYNGFCCCPFHDEDTPSCCVNNVTFHCFGCGEKGNAITFVSKLFNINHTEAMQKLDADFGLRLLDQELSDEQKQKILQRKRIEYERKKEKTELESKKEEYLEAWKTYVYNKPKEENYNIDSPAYLVDDYFAKIDSRFIKAFETIQRLDNYAELYGFKIEEFEAEQMFIYGTQRTQHDVIEQEIVKEAYERNYKSIEDTRRINA